MGSTVLSASQGQRLLRVEAGRPRGSPSGKVEAQAFVEIEGRARDKAQLAHHGASPENLSAWAQVARAAGLSSGADFRPWSGRL